MRDTKALFNKHKDEFYKNTGKLKKWKWAQPNQKFDASNDINAVYSSYNEMAETVRTKSEDFKESISSGDFLDDILSGCADTSTTRKEFSKDYHDHLYKDEESYTDEAVPSNIKSEIAVIMQNNKLIGDIKKSNAAVDKVFNGILKSIDKCINDLAGTISKNPEKGSNFAAPDVKDKDGKQHSVVYGGDNETVMDKLNVLRSATSVGQTATNIVASAYLSEVKFHIRQCRRVFGQITSMRAAKNEAVLLDVIGESAEYEIESSFEDYEV